MKRLIGIMVMVVLTLGLSAQPAVLVMNEVTDSTVVNFGISQEVYKWDSIYVEVLGTSLAAADTTGAIEIYNTLNGDFTDATDLVSSGALTLADGAGGTGTIMKSTWITGANFSSLRIVYDVSDSDSGSAKITVRVQARYKQGYSPPRN